MLVIFLIGKSLDKQVHQNNWIRDKWLKHFNLDKLRLWVYFFHLLICHILVRCMASSLVRTGFIRGSMTQENGCYQHRCSNNILEVDYSLYCIFFLLFAFPFFLFDSLYCIFYHFWKSSKDMEHRYVIVPVLWTHLSA